mmetsp:Transcript_13757/g.20749  ORF Transcript_13757/g.20749 Transcript_13757/m.20749 type:complete len:399 (-) Transcript_13757:9-1205(-)|eukprot:CAMPEP_0201547526 /NCGR_PEP_ID=MMETSP0173_2-20130828/3998_1 /ASSEMBLY_ACC=CAM_ASM_000268 /TAXON_ID=218659 /ORGANISM="Vexillifera sp., Strain DIVA3 564/2" /LENGTH=398 /DNA_ID=CAMNT_0047956605 /DNA_START=35 /DNA_END=1231 /DNA_ORIENTATION=+
MSSVEGESSGSFTGVFTLKTQEEAVELAECVRRIVEGAVNIFYVIEKEPQTVKQLTTDLQQAIKLIYTFPALCSSEDLKERAIKTIDELNKHASPCIVILQSTTNGEKLDAQQSEKLAEHMKQLLLGIASVCDMMEEEQINRLLKFVNSSFQHVLIFKQTRSDYRLDAKLRAAIIAWKTLGQQMKKRASVTEDESTKNAIIAATGEITSSAAGAVRATQTVAKDPSAANIQAQDQALLPMVSGYTKLIHTIKTSGRVSSSADFAFEGINRELEALRAAVKSGSTQAAVESAKAIAGELSNLENQAQQEDDAEARRRLEESLAGLKNMTAALVSATKDALADPTQSDKLGNIVDDMKGQVVACSKVKRKKRGGGLKDRLVQAAQKLSVGIDDLADTTTT